MKNNQILLLMGCNFKRKVGDPSSVDFSLSDIHLAPFIIGIILIVVGLLDMLALFFIPFSKIKSNKKKYPDQSFDKIKVPIVVIHFILHFFVITFGIILLLIALEVDICNEMAWISAFIFIIVALWIVELALGFSMTHDTLSQIKISDLLALLSDDSPSNLIFIYTHDTYTTRSCTNSGKKRKCRTTTHHCYSKSGISIPIETKLISNSSEFANYPSLYYLNVQQEVKMSLELRNYYSEILRGINGCDTSHHKEIEYHPIVVGDYIVTTEKVPVGLSKATRISSIMFGVGVYYELYSKSIPHITYVQKFDADVVNDFNYNVLWTSGSCSKYGICSTKNKKPSP